MRCKLNNGTIVDVPWQIHDGAYVPACTVCAKMRETRASAITIPPTKQLIYYGFVGPDQSPKGEPCIDYENGTVHAYYGDWTNTYIAPIMTSIIGAGEDGPNSPAVQRFLNTGVNLLGYVQSDRLDRWDQYMLSPYSGVFIDEFIAGHDDPAAIAKILSLPGEKLYLWLGIGWNTNLEDFRSLLDVVLPHGCYWCPEYYLNTDEPDLMASLQTKLIDRMQQFATMYPQYLSKCIPTLVIADEYDDNPNADWMACLDLQVRVVATNSVFANTGGICCWTSYKTTAERLHWWAALMQHYFVEKKTDLLCPRPLSPS